MSNHYGDGKYGPIRNWSRGCFMSHGGMGEIFVGKNVDNGQLFLVKSVSSEPAWSKQLAALQNEEQILRKLSKKKCPNILRTVGNAASEFVEEMGGKPTMDLFLEFAMLRGNLNEIIKRSGKLKESVAKAYTIQILQALSCMHNNGIVHRAIRPQNIIVCERGVKLVDFGLAKDLSPPPRGTHKSTEKKAMISLPPECQNDIYALGLVVCEMVIGRRPKLDPSLPMEKAIRTLEEDFVKNRMLNAMSFIESCLLRANVFEAKDFGEGHWTAERLLTHPWIATKDLFSPPDFSSDDEAATTGSLTSREIIIPPLLLKTDAITQTATVSPRKKCADMLCCRRMDTDNVIPPLSSRSIKPDHKPPRKGLKFSRVLPWL
ncbi:unnamed protein product [Calypogeia fissa]